MPRDLPPTQHREGAQVPDQEALSGQQGGQPAVHIGIPSCSLEAQLSGLPEAGDGLPPGVQAEGVPVDVFVGHEATAGTQGPLHLLEIGREPGEEHRHPAAPDQIKTTHLKRGGTEIVLLHLQLRQPLSLSSRPGMLHVGRAAFQREHVAIGTHRPRQLDAAVSGASPQIEHAHSGTQPGSSPGPSGLGQPEFVLQPQPLPFTVVVAENVAPGHSHRDSTM